MGTDRRTFTKRIVATAVMLGPAAQLVRPGMAGAGQTVEGFRFEHDESVVIVLDFARSPQRYDISVRKDGQEVESFANVHPSRLGRLDSDNFDVVYYDVA